MDKFIIKGGKKLSGRVSVSGAKNSSLALMPATLLTSGISTIYNVPEVNDIFTMIKLLEQLGAKINFFENNLKIDTTNINNQVAPYELVKKMRASIYVLGPLLSRFGYAKVSMPGGCAWGPRPINLHLEAMKKLGAEIEIDQGYIIAKANKLKGAKIHFDVPSVGATGNTLMAAVLAKGTTIISNAAIEPEISLLAEFLQLMGAKISGIGTTIMEIEGVEELSNSEIINIPDRIEAGTLLLAGAITGSKIELENVVKEHLEAVLNKIEESGAKLSSENGLLIIDAENLSIKNVDVTTAVFPGFPTDMQAQWIAYMSIANGISTITDTIYPDRFNHVPELNRLGANIEVINNSAIVRGVKNLKGAKVMSTDLRASACLVLAGLAAENTTEVLRVYHLDRGYQRIEEKLRALGADIERVQTEEY
ncbi:MAG: UDP-N-acetylglucosamine 1-carboxyvinyltransferase [Melioribacter sp.]|uniref:UDP-N-acetylglucosamine 1-carboxyvinyltransferase n=1 Tax=Rosettibacter primus TaxID=3111523 RepID=UPI00247B9648|nr:UDP-N-acetylglucosamine 1-carboxyvinyltransferase [Melioribacter sp.]